MKAIVQRKYGSPTKVFNLEDVAAPAVGDDEVLVRVVAAGVNPADWHIATGEPYLARAMFGLRKPKAEVPGLDAAGVVEAFGKNVTGFQLGDNVYGEVGGAYAEFLSAKENRLQLIPKNLTFEQAASVPIAAVTALQGLRDKGKVEAGQRVLVNGASGGVGTFAVQIAKSMGAEVTGVCSTRNLEVVQSIGADDVIDYTVEDFTKGAQRYDVILDNVGGHPLADFRRLLTAEGTYVSVGASMGNWIGPLVHLLKIRLASAFRSQKMVSMLAKQTPDDMATLASLFESGAVSPVMDRTYKLSETAEALEYQGEGHTRGKTVITM